MGWDLLMWSHLTLDPPLRSNEEPKSGYNSLSIGRIGLGW